MTDPAYYADEVPEAVASGVQALRKACDAWPHQTAAPDLSSRALTEHLSVCYALRHPGYLDDAAWTGVVTGAAVTALLLAAIVLLARRMTRRPAAAPGPSSARDTVEVPVRAEVPAAAYQQTLEDLREEISVDVGRGAGPGR